MAVQNSTVERPASTAPVLTPADVAAHQAQESPTVPSEPAARRRFVAQRGW